ncbi:lithostathine-like [Ctenodactylus gundi]
MLPPTALPSVSWMLLSCLMLLSQVQGEDSQVEQAATRISCPAGSKAYGSYCYALFRTPKAWFEADLACQKRPKGHLASVINGAEATFVSTLIKSTVSSFSYVWIGLHDPTQGQEPNGNGWAWSSTDLLDYLNWERNPSSASDHGYCGSVSRNSEVSFPAHDSLNGACEREIHTKETEGAWVLHSHLSSQRDKSCFGR